MQVKDLIAILQDMPEEANVYLADQPSYPFEVSVAGVTVREDFTDGDEEDGVDEDGTPTYGTFGLSSRPGIKKRGDDVFILQGAQLSYGSKDMWNNPRRS